MMMTYSYYGRLDFDREPNKKLYMLMLAESKVRLKEIADENKKKHEELLYRIKKRENKSPPIA